MAASQHSCEKQGVKIAFFLLGGQNCYDGKHREPKVHLSQNFLSCDIFWNPDSLLPHDGAVRSRSSISVNYRQSTTQVN